MNGNILNAFQLVIMSGVLVGITAAAIRIGKLTGRLEALLSTHSRELERLWEHKQDKEVCEAILASGGHTKEKE